MTLYSHLQMEQERLAALPNPRRKRQSRSRPKPAAVEEPKRAHFQAQVCGRKPDVPSSSEAELVERPDTILDYRKLAAEIGQRFMVYLKGK